MTNYFSAGGGAVVTVPGTLTGKQLDIYKLGGPGDANYERLRVDVSANLRVTAQKGGTGASRHVEITAVDGQGIQIAEFASLNFIGSANGQYLVGPQSDSIGVRLNGRITAGATPSLEFTNLAFGSPFSAASGTQTLVKLSGTVNQSGTAGYIGCHVAITETAVGSGIRELFRGDVGGNKRFNVRVTDTITLFSLFTAASGSTEAVDGMSFEFNSTDVFLVNREDNGRIGLWTSQAGVPAERVIVRAPTNGTVLESLGSVGAKANNPVRTAAYTADATDFLVLCNASGGAFTVTLPAAAAAAGRIYTIKKIDSSANAVTVDGAGAETIDGAATRNLAAQYDALLIQSDGSNWHRLLLS